MVRHRPKINQRLPLEMQLLASCCDWPRRAETAGRIEALASQIEDWDRTEQLARRHQLQAFMQAQLSDQDIIPDRLNARWAAEARQRAMMNLSQARETLRLQGELDALGIPNLVLKGLPLAAQIYGSLSITFSGDIDLLIQPQQALAALRRLEQMGYLSAMTGKPLTAMQVSTVLRHRKEIGLRHDDGTMVDLHWRLVDPAQYLTGIKPFAHARDVNLKGLGRCRVLGERDAFAYLCTHGALSDWDHLKWLCDVNALLKTYEPEQVRKLVAHAHDLGVGHFAVQALNLREIIFAEPVPDGIDRTVDTLPEDETLNFYLDCIMHIGPAPSFRHKAVRMWRASKARGQAHARPIEAILPMRSHLFALPDMLALPLPRGLDFLYPLLRPFLWLRRRLSPDSPAP